jgi:hypothetical protein
MIMASYFQQLQRLAAPSLREAHCVSATASPLRVWNVPSICIGSLRWGISSTFRGGFLWTFALTITNPVHQHIQREAAPQAHIKLTLYSTRSVPRAARTPMVLPLGRAIARSPLGDYI